MRKLSDYVSDFIAESGVRDVFMVTGGGAMHLNDSIGTNKRLRYWSCHHEQAAAIAAEIYARLTGFACVNVTTGPGGTNTLTGLMGAWTDSVPVLFISGNVRKPFLGAGKHGLRQLGVQELNIVTLVKSIVKYAKLIVDPLTIRYELEKASYLARSGRPGPVWIDIPLDVQAAMIDEKKLVGFVPPKVKIFSEQEVEKQVSRVVKLLETAKRPVIVGGGGIRIANAVSQLRTLIDKLHVPVLTSMSAHDVIPSDYRFNYGRIGMFGDRPGNFIVQNSDLVISIGSRLHLQDIGMQPELWARYAKKVIVDIDKAELTKPTIRPDIAIQSDAKFFINELMHQSKSPQNTDRNEWLDYCKRLRRTYPVVLLKYLKQKKYVNSYYFTQVLSEELRQGDIIVTANGTALTGTRQVFQTKKQQRFISNIGCASMGYGLPGAIGAAIAIGGKKRIICICGDGSIQMNLQELQTIVHHKLPIKIFVLNNNGYLAIRNTQNAFFQRRYVGTDKKHGISFPDMVKIAHAYGIHAVQMKTQHGMRRQIQKLLRMKGPVLCDIYMDPKQLLIPKVASLFRKDGSIVSKPLEDMYPFLSREEFRKHMIVPPMSEPE